MFWSMRRPSVFLLVKHVVVFVVVVEMFRKLYYQHRERYIYIERVPFWLSQDHIVRILALCAYNLQRFIELQDSSGLVLSDEESEEAANCLQTHLRLYAVLADYYFKRRIMMFKIRCKSHYLWHTASEVRLWKLNQNLWHTFQEESFLGKLKAIGVKCHGRSCSLRMFQRYFLCLAIFLQDFRKMES